MEQPRIVPKAEVTETLIRNLINDQEAFKDAIYHLKHGEKNRLMDAMISYPLTDPQFDEEEPELRTALSIYKRISDSLVALGTEAAIEGILAGFEKNQQLNELQGVTNVEATTEKE
jgi:hypothetical protein